VNNVNGKPAANGFRSKYFFRHSGISSLNPWKNLIETTNQRIFQALMGAFISEIQRALRFLHRPDRNTVGVDHGGLQAGMPQEILKHADVGPRNS
jgi:hypothetical protein